MNVENLIQRSIRLMATFINGFTFDDVLLVPKHSSISSRDDVDLSVSLPKNITLKIPILSSNMRSVTGVKMAVTLSNLGGLPVLHRFDEYQKLISNFIEAKDLSSGEIGASVGIKDKDHTLVKDLHNVGCNIICVDVAHGDHDRVCDFVSNIRAIYPNMLLIAGNVATESGANNLWMAGADIIKCGVGNGAVCSTRIETGNGYPQLSALDSISKGCYKCRDGNQWPMFIADGGISSAGSCVKSLALVDLVMIGNLFAGTDEAPGEIIVNNGQKFKKYEGSSTHKSKHVEGVIALVPYKGSVTNIVTRLIEGIKSGCSYQGVNNLIDLKRDPEFVIISNAGLRESHPHDVIM